MPVKPQPVVAQKSKKRYNTSKPQKKPVSVEESLRRLFKTLCTQIDGGHFKNALKTCDKGECFACPLTHVVYPTFTSSSRTVLRIDPKDTDALRAKLFLLLQTEQYETALSLLQSLDNQAAYEFERAYALYRLRREPEAADVLSHLKDSERPGGVHNRAIMHLEAQLVLHFIHPHCLLT